MKFDYKKIISDRFKFPLLGAGISYKKDGDIKNGDVLINNLIEDKPSEAIIIVPKNFLFLLGAEKKRNDLLDIYEINGLVDIGNMLGNGIVECSLLWLSMSPNSYVKVAKYTGKVIEHLTKQPPELEALIGNLVRRKKLLSEEEMRILQETNIPEYTDEFINFFESIMKWFETGEEITSERYFNKIVNRTNWDNNHLSSMFYTDEALEFFKYIQNEKFNKLKDIADVYSGFEGTTSMPKDFAVKKVGFGQFEYPLNYEKLPIGHPMRKVRYLRKGDIIASTLHSDGKLKCYLMNEEPKEEITVGGSCCIIRAKKVSPEYLYLYLQSETVDKYIFYNNPFLQISVPVLNKVPIAMPTEQMDKLSTFIFGASHSNSGSIPVDSINSLLREDNHIDIADRPLQSLMLEELISNIKMEKRGLIADIISADANEVTECFNAGAYKACLVLCGSILETVLLDWLSELEETNYFVDDENMQINLYGVIRRLKEIYSPEWNAKARAAHDIRLKRNLVHPVKCIVEQPVIDKETCLFVINEMKEILISRGIDNNLHI